VFESISMPLACALTMNEVNPILQQDASLSGPAVRLRFSPLGLASISRTLSDAILKEILSSSFPFQPKPVRMSGSSVEVSSLSLISISIPSSSLPSVVPLPPNSLTTVIHGISMTLLGSSSGRLSEGPFSTPLLLNATHASLAVRIAVTSDSMGNPLLKMTSCDIPKGFPMVVSYNRTLGLNSRKELVSLASHDAVSIFRDVICPQVKFLLEKRISERFGLLPPKMSLADNSNADLLKLISDGQKLRERRISGVRRTRQTVRSQGLLKHFDLTRADNLFLDYAMTQPPVVNQFGLNIYSSGEIGTLGGKTPFGSRQLPLAPPNNSSMMQISLSDFVPNSLMYHGHKTGLFNTRVDPSTPHFGPMMRSTCDLSTGSLFCIGDIFPTLRSALPNRGIAFIFSTMQAPALIVRPESAGGIFFELAGLMEVRAIERTGEEKMAGKMTLDISGSMKMRMTSKVVKGKITLDQIVMKTMTPDILSQEELDDAGFLSHEIVQRMVNDILRDGIPIPVHPLFKLRSPKLTLYDRSFEISTDFILNSKLIRQFTAQDLNDVIKRAVNQRVV
ncbi:hypothetical protein PMAYCL1PPCAC_12544, partial [Pristionchus mayeri]